MQLEYYYAIMILIVLVNVFAIVISRRGDSRLRKLTGRVGIASFLFMILVILGFLDGLSQVWVARAGYEGKFFFFSLGLLGVSTSLAFLFSIWILMRKKVP